MEEKKKVGVGFGVMILKEGNVLLGKRHEDPEKASSLLKGGRNLDNAWGKIGFWGNF